MDMAMRFMDIRKRVYTFPHMGDKAYFIAIPTSSGTGSEVTPFAVITDDKTGTKYPLADYELLPKMAIVDTNMMMSAPKGLTSASGIDAVTHAFGSLCINDGNRIYRWISNRSIKENFEYLPRAYENGQNDVEAREKNGSCFNNGRNGFCKCILEYVIQWHIN